MFHVDISLGNTAYILLEYLYITSYKAKTGRAWVNVEGGGGRGIVRGIARAEWQCDYIDHYNIIILIFI